MTGDCKTQLPWTQPKKQKRVEGRESGENGKNNARIWSFLRRKTTRRLKASKARICFFLAGGEKGKIR